MNKIICFLLILSIVIASCNKPKDSKVNHYKIAQGLKDYFNWQAGTYWVFTDTLTGKKDSFIVTGYSDVDESQYDYTDELKQIGIAEYYNPDSGNVFRSWNLEIHSGKNENYTHLSSPGHLHLYYRFTVGFPFNLNSDVPDVTKALMPSTSVNGKLYSNVYQYYISNNDEILVNADSGFIKFRLSIYTHQVLELDHCHIIH